jgi:PAS domain S-box-containing protein
LLCRIERVEIERQHACGGFGQSILHGLILAAHLAARYFLRADFSLDLPRVGERAELLQSAGDAKALSAGLEELLAQSGICGFACDRDGCITSWHGMRMPGAAPPIGRSAFELCQDVPWLLAALRRALAGEPLPVEGELCDGFYQGEVRPVTGPEGLVAGVIALVIDRSAEKRRAHALGEATAMLRTLTESSPLAIIATDEGGKVTVWNPAAERLLGYAEAELIGQPSPYPPVLDANPREPIAIVRLQRRKRDGDSVEVTVTAARIEDVRGRAIGELQTLCDTSAQQRAELRLRQAEERVRAVIEGAPVILFALDRNGVFTLSEGKGLIGLGRQPGQSVGHSVYELYRDVPWHLDGVRRALAGESVTGSGEVAGLWYQVHYEPLRGAAGEVAGVIGVATDVTERKRAGDALKREHEFASAVIDTAAALVMVLDRDGRIVRFNRACEELFGYGFDEVRGQAAWDVLAAPEERAQVREAFQGIPAGRFPSRAETQCVTRDGERHLVAWWHSALVGTGDRVEHVIATGIDVTERRRAEQDRTRLLARAEVARAEAEVARQGLAFLYQATSAMLIDPMDYVARIGLLARLGVPFLADWCVVDLVAPDGSIRRAGVCHRDAEKAELARQLERFAPEMGAPEGVAVVLRTGEPVCRDHIRDQDLVVGVPTLPVSSTNQEHVACIRALGLRSYLSVPLTARGRILGALTFVSASDEQRYGPSELALAEDLARRAAVALDNARLYEAAQEAVRAREEFLSVASHELRTPLTSLQLALQSLLRVNASGGLSSAPSGFVGNVLATAERQTRRLGRLIDDLLDVSRITAGRLDLHWEDVDLAEVTRDVAQQMRADLGAAGCPLTLEVALPVVGRWDRARLEQVVANLLSNALKYGAGKPIWVAVAPRGDTAILTVRDHGIGIARDVQTHIFDRFERGVSSRHYGGLGLGLYIVRRILDGLGGSVWVESELGAGATFTVELPRRAGADRGPRW